MTDFETEVYHRDDNNIIGARVIVSADNGQTIDDIQVTNKTQFDELEAKLDVLDETYVRFAETSTLTDKTIDEILTNSNETTPINATLLAGLQSDAFSKTNHTHRKVAISDLYSYDIGLSEYNPTLSDVITVRVEVTDTSNSPVKNHRVIIYKDGVQWKTGTTNNNGVFTTNYIVETNGLTTFAVNNQKIQCLVTGWKEIDIGLPTNPSSQPQNKFLINEELHLAHLSFFIGECNRWANQSAANEQRNLLGNTVLIPEQYRPINRVLQPMYRSAFTAYVGNDGGIDGYSTERTGSNPIQIRFNQMWYYGEGM